MNRTGRFALSALAAVAVLSGCSRKPPQFIPAGEDSTASVSTDSLAAQVARLQDQWESQGGVTAAPATARLVVEDLGRHPDQPVAERARTFIDSCAFSGEVAGVGDLAAVNLFARSDPTGGSWPYLIWRDQDKVRQQAIEASGMRLLDLAPPDAATASSAGGDDVPLRLAAVFGRSGARGQQPVVIVWQRAPGAAAWTLAQTLGADSLGGVGVAEFQPGPGGTQAIVARTYRSTPGFDECATCPHVHRTARFEWQGDGYARVSEDVAESPYYSFVQLIAALAVGDRDMALRFLDTPTLLDDIRGYDWGAGKGVWRVAPGTEESAEEMTLFHGRKDAYKVRFAERAGHWVVADIQPTERTLE